MQAELAEGREGLLAADQIPIGVRRWKDPKGWDQTDLGDTGPVRDLQGLLKDAFV